MKSGIYKIRIKNHFYIGSATNIKKRFNRHLHDLRKNKHANNKLQNYFNKYSEKEILFEIIEFVGIENLITKEQMYLELLKPDINICQNAGNTLNRKHTEETKKKYSIDRKNKISSFGWHHTDETKKILSGKAKERGAPLEATLAAKNKNIGLKHDKKRIFNRCVKQIKLNLIQISEINDLLNKGVYQKDIAKIYNVSQRVISKIKNKIGIYADLRNRQRIL